MNGNHLQVPTIAKQFPAIANLSILGDRNDKYIIKIQYIDATTNLQRFSYYLGWPNASGARSLDSLAYYMHPTIPTGTSHQKFSK